MRGMRALLPLRRRRSFCCSTPPVGLDFSDHSMAYQHKSLWELVRALGVLKVCSYDWLVDNSQWLLTTGERVLGRNLMGALVGPTFYRQFAGGATPQEMRACVDRLCATRVRTMVACSLEDDDGNGQRSVADAASASQRRVAMYGRNGEAVLSCLRMTSELSSESPMMQVKMSGLLPPHLLAHLTRIFNSTEKPELIISCLGDAVRSDSYREYSDMQLESSDHKFLELALKNLHNVCQTAKDAGVTILVDAEFADMNGGIELLGLALMAAFNERTPLVWNTYQCYLTDTPDKVGRHLCLATRMGASFGVKLVRGAYMDGERRKARERCEVDAVCSSYRKTNENYDRVLCYLLEHICCSERECCLVVATHNEDSIRTATKRMQELGLAVNDERVSFGQLLGMYDHITFPLAARGYNVYKSIPYGPPSDLLLYLARRASENRSVLSSPVIERRMLAAEIRRRLAGSWKRPLEPAHN
ncbi:hydroxyproline dehydrogenase-like [Dermacentor andersoni]|uniref:hydroxyproline dehydrogenase-like n=1 Tax=Dermacentor andersoni TaxID=34620 RepID=UPI0021552793|nr:hydroxyproline dehydrogenase-like [Dermacentor andersoni]